jgi:hypothetical protein
MTEELFPRSGKASVYILPALLVLVAWIWHDFTVGFPWYGMDDAYIVAHNAQVLHWGHDPNYVGVSPLAGTTSPVYLALVSLLLFVVPLPWTLDVVGWLATLAYALGIAHLCRVKGVRTLPSLGIVLVGLIVAQVPHQLTNGLETGLMLATVTWAIALLSEQDMRHARLLAAICGALPYVRPDLLPLAGLLFGALAFKRRRLAGEWTSAARSIGIDGLFAAMAALPWAIWLLSSLGSLYSPTSDAKRYFFAQAGLSIRERWAFLWRAKSFFTTECDICGIGWILTVLYGGNLLPIVFLGFATTFLAAYFTQFPGALGTYEHRYLMPFIPWLLLGFASALGAGRNETLRIRVGWCLALGLVLSLLDLPDRWDHHLRVRVYGSSQLDKVAAWCNTNLPQDSTLLVHDAGYIAYGTHFKTVDMVGLKTPSSIEYHRKLTFPSNGWRRIEAIGAIARNAHANYLLVLWLWEQDYGIAAGLRSLGWNLTPLTEPGTFAFQVYHIDPPKVFLSR